MVEQDRNVKFLRVDSGVADALKGDGESLESKELSDLFVKVSGKDDLKVSFENLKDETLPAMLTVSEQDRRFGDMMKLYGMQENMPSPTGELILNSNCGLIKRLCEKVTSAPESAEEIAKYIDNLSLLAQRRLDGEELKAFLAGSYGMLDKLI